MALIETLVDDFNTLTIDSTKWSTGATQGSGTVSSAGGAATFSANASSSLYLISPFQYTANNSSVYARLRPTAAHIADPAGGAMYLCLGSNSGTGYGIAYYGIQYNGGNAQLSFQVNKSNTSSTQSLIGAITYNATTMAYLRIRAVGSQFTGPTLYAEYSADGSTWTALANTTTNWSGTNDSSVQVRFNNYNQSTAYVGYCDSVNVVNTTYVPPVLLSALVDNFDAGTLDPAKWSTYTSNGYVGPSAGGVNISAGAGGASYLQAVKSYLPLGSSIYFKATFTGSNWNLAIIELGNYGPTGASRQTYGTVQLRIQPTQYSFTLTNASGSQLNATTNFTYTPATMIWWRMRFDGSGNFFGAYSADGTNWTEQQPAGQAVDWIASSYQTSPNFYMGASSSNSSAMQLDNVNTLGAINAAPTGINDAETIGAPVGGYSITANPNSVSDPETLGTPSAALTNTVNPTGINDANTAGNPSANSVQAAAPGSAGDPENVGAPAAAMITATMPAGIGDAETFGIPTLTMVLTTVPYGTGNYGVNLYGGNPPAPTWVTPDSLNDTETIGTTGGDATGQANVGYGSGIYGMGVYSGGTVQATTVNPTGINDAETLNGAASDGTATGATNYTYGTGTYGAGLYGGPDTGTTYGGDASTGAATTGYGSGPYGAGIYPGVTVSDTAPTQTSIPLFDNLPAGAKAALQLLAVGPWSPTVEFRGAVNYGIGKGRRPARPIMNLPIANSLSVTLRLTGGCEATAAFSFDRGSAIVIEEMHTDLWWRRKDPYTGALDVIGRFNTGTNDLSYDGTALASNVHFVDYETLLGERLVLKYRNTYADGGQPTSQFAKDEPVTNVLKFAIPTNMGLDLSVLDDDTILGNLTGLFTVDPSWALADVFTNVMTISPKPWEWWIEQPADLSKAPKLRLQVGERGTNKGIVLVDLGSGPSPIASWTMQAATTSYANAIYYQGGSGGVIETIPSQISEFGQRDTTFSNASLNKELQPIINAAQIKLKELADRRPTFTVVLRPGFWRGRTHIDIGDTVRIVLRLGKEVLDYSYRVTELQLDIDTTGAETVTLTLGTPLVSADPRSRRSTIFRLLRTLRNYVAPNNSNSQGTLDPA